MVATVRKLHIKRLKVQDKWNWTNTMKNWKEVKYGSEMKEL
jgi:hypothetical protein